jgi:protein CpxP
MSTESQTSQTPETSRTPPHRRGGARKLLALVAILGVAGAGIAWAGHRGGAACAGFGHGGPGGGFGHKLGRLHVEFAVDRALRAAEATPEQREKVEAILERAFAERASFREQHKTLHGEAMAALTADTIDRGRLEALRVQHMQIAEQGSRQVTGLVAEVAEVLTLEQRQKLAAHARQMFE